MSASVVADFLKSQFQKARGGVLSSLLGTPQEYHYGFHERESHPAQPLFPDWNLKWIEADEGYLPVPLLPGSHSRALFAYKDDSCLLLTKDLPESLTTLLRESSVLDSLSNDQNNVPLMVELLCDALLSEGAKTQLYVKSLEHIVQLPSLSGFAKYVPNETELKRLAPEMKEATFSSDYLGAGTFTFLTLSGWMHQKSTLLRHSLRFTPEMKIEHEQTTLSEKIYSSMPQVRY